MRRSLKQSLLPISKWNQKSPILTHKNPSRKLHSSQINTDEIPSKENIPFDHLTLMKLIDSSGLIQSSSLFDEHRKFIDVELCNFVIRSFTQSNKHQHSLFVYTQMRKAGILPNSSTFPALLKSVAQLYRPDIGKLIHCSVIQMSFESDVYLGTALVHMYCVCVSVSEGRKMFDEMPVRNVVSWNALITGYTHNRMFREVIDVFREMESSGVSPGEVTVVGVLSACAHLGALNQGKWIHECIVYNRLRLNVFVGTALIDMYAKCGVIDEAVKVFKSMRVKNVYSWNVLISGLAMNGQGEAALNTFSMMIVETYKPDVVTFLGVLCACCHQGLIDEGRKQFSSMVKDYQLLPRIEHYGCMVDLLGRAGFLMEAHDLIKEMRLRPDPAIWRALLGACRIHGNTQLGEFAVKNLLDLEPNKAENYVMLANLYARDRRWVKVGEVRALMDQRSIQKVPGCSSIEIDNVVYEFVVSDIIKPGLEEVHRLLAEMNMELKLSGYFVDTDMVSYDLEEEEKERSLMYHSEKLALACGILKSPPDSTLRILKNLRICRDCHCFFKLVSKVYKRDITVRDRNRFHHFVGGVCSCKDYW